MSSKPTAKAAVGRPATKGTALGSTPMAKSASSSSATGAKSKASAASTSSATSNGGSSQPVQPYREIMIARSDGVGFSTQQINDASRSAQPVGDALDDNDEFMRSWTVKLGKAIKYNLGASSSSSSSATDSTNYLVRFPTGYSLHVRPGKTKDRDMPLVFGHPLGPLAAFRSPAELALHVLWLFSDSKERADCSCRLCVRMVSEAAAAAAAAATSAATASAATAAAAAAAATTVPAPQAVKPSPRTPTVTPVPVPVIPSASPAVAPATATAAAAKPASSTSVTPVPPPSVAPAAVAAQPAVLPPPENGGSALFRPWELVWYQHFTQQSRGAWRLGIVLQTLPSVASTEPPPSIMPGPSGTARVAPLGIPGLHPPEITIDTSALRPFLSFSVPGMREGLQGASYDRIDWQKLAWEAQQQQQQQQPGQYDIAILALEASKSSANQINACFSVFNPMQKTSPTQQYFGGVFLGAEQVVLGDALRVDVKPVAGAADDGNGNGNVTVEIMRVALIVRDNFDLHFIGDVYRLAVTGPGLPPQPQPVYGPTGQILPSEPIFAEELAERNHASQATNSGLTWYWQLREHQSRRNENEVHGRFYASTRLAANLQNGEFLQRVAQRQPTGPVAGDDSSMMSSALNRRQQVSGFMYQGQRANRAATIGQAMSVPLPPIAGVTEEY